MQRPRLLVALVLDQLGSRVLERMLEHLPRQGALARAVRQGAYHRRVVFSYASTVTAPGHAAIHSGAAPIDSGIVTNNVLDRRLRRFVRPEDDGKHQVFGMLTGEFAGPAKLRAPTVADMLKRATGGQGKVVSVSMKARAAVLSGGQRPDLVAWYESSIPGFTTSNYYAETLPDWMREWRTLNPVQARFGIWHAGDPALLQRLFGADAAPGEGDGERWQAAFPHALAKTALATESFLATPQSSEYLFDFALASARHYRLGEDEVPDLLALSVSSTDYVGHLFGADSWEYLDNLQRVDAALTRLVEALQARAPTAFLLTSDHGAAPLPEKAASEGRKAGRITDAAVVDAANTALAATLGASARVEAFGQPLLYLNDAARLPQRRTSARRAVMAALQTIDGIGGAFDFDEALTWRDDADALRRAVGRSVHGQHQADLYVMPAPYFVIGLRSGTTHGTPWSYDREVPVVMWGVGVEPSQTMQPWEQQRVATTMARLLGVPIPRFAHPQPLPGVAP